MKPLRLRVLTAICVSRRPVSVYPSSGFESRRGHYDTPSNASSLPSLIALCSRAWSASVWSA